MESPFLPPSSPSGAIPLFPVSPERMNRRAGPQTPSCLSPRLKDDPFFSSNHRVSDVQGKVLQFNQLQDSSSPKRKENNDAALRRALLGREEAESKTRMLEEEIDTLRQEVEDGQVREHKVAQRVEDMMEDVQRHKESALRAQAVYEKEIKRARKEAFKSSSALVKVQEELKTARNRYTLMRTEAEEFQRRSEEREQEAFSAQLKLVGMQGEMDKMRALMMTVEQERDTLRASLKEEEIARIAAEGRIPLPPAAADDDDEFSSPGKTPSKKDDAKAAVETPEPRRSLSRSTSAELDARVRDLEHDLQFERRLRTEAQETVHFMKLECQLQTCSCRRAERVGGQYIHDARVPAMSPPPMASKTIMTTVNPSTQESETAQPDESVIIRHTARAELPIAFVHDSPGDEHDTASTTSNPRSPVSSHADDASTSSKSAAIASLRSPLLAAASKLDVPLAPTAISGSPSLLSLPSRPGSRDNEVTPAHAIRPLPMTPHHNARPQDDENTRHQSRPLSPPQPQSHSQHMSHGSHQQAHAAVIPAPSLSSPPAPVTASLSTTSTTNSAPTSHHPSRPHSHAAPHAHREQNPYPTSNHSQTNVHTQPQHHNHERGRTQTTTTMASRPMPRTTTVKVPLAEPDSSASTQKYPFSPGATKTREEALQSIQRWREGRSRTRSVTTGNMSTGRAVSTTRTGRGSAGTGTGAGAKRARAQGNGSPVRRDISAPERRGFRS